MNVLKICYAPKTLFFFNLAQNFQNWVTDNMYYIFNRQIMWIFYETWEKNATKKDGFWLPLLNLTQIWRQRNGWVSIRHLIKQYRAQEMVKYLDWDATYSFFMFSLRTTKLLVTFFINARIFIFLYISVHFTSLMSYTSDVPLGFWTGST